MLACWMGLSYDGDGDDNEEGDNGDDYTDDDDKDESDVQQRVAALGRCVSSLDGPWLPHVKDCTFQTNGQATSAHGNDLCQYVIAHGSYILLIIKGIVYILQRQYTMRGNADK